MLNELSTCMESCNMPIYIFLMTDQNQAVPQVGVVLEYQQAEFHVVIQVSYGLRCLIGGCFTGLPASQFTSCDPGLLTTGAAWNCSGTLL